MARWLGKRWLWITVLFAAINAVGLWQIVSVLEGQRSRLDVEAFHPNGVTSTEAVVSCRFDQPMVGADGVGKAVPEDWFRITPTVPGEAVWRDTRTLVFEPQEELRLATPYIVTLSRETASLLGHALPSDRVYEFETPAFDLLNVGQTGRSRDAELTLTLTFNDLARPEEIAQHLTLTGDGEKKVSFEPMGRTPTHEVRIRTRPYLGSWLVAGLAKGCRGESGPLGLPDDRTVRIEIAKGLRIREVEGYAGSPHNVYVGVTCTEAVETGVAAKFVQVEPAVKFRVSSSYNGFKLIGPFEPGKRYRLTFQAGLPGRHANCLEKDTVRRVTIPDLEPSLRFRTRGIYLSAQGGMRLPLECVNIEKAEFALERVYANNVVHYLRELDEGRGRYHRRYPDDLSHVVAERTIRPKGERNAVHTEAIDLRALLGDNKHGLFLASARDAKRSYRNDQKVILVTDLGLTVKRSRRDLLVWVTELSTAKPVPNATVSVFTRANQQILDGTTDEQGVAHFTQVDGSEDREPFAAAASRGDDTTFVVLDETKVDGSELDTGGRAYLRDGYEAFLYSDRGIYRPGSDIVLRAIVRGPGLTVPKPFPVQFRVFRPDGRQYKTLTAKLSKWGSAEVQVHVPDYALTGRYKVSLLVPGADKPMGGHAFQVEEFLPDRLKTEIVAEDRRLRAGEKFAFTVKGAHLFGSPAAGRQAEARCAFVGATFSHPDWAGYRFQDSGRKPVLPPAVAQRGILDEQGEKRFEIEVPKTLASASAIDSILTATVKEMGGRGVSTSVRRRVDPYPRYVGVARTTKSYGAIGKTERIRVAVVRPDGSPAPTAEVEGRAVRILWNSVLREDDNGRLRYVSERQEEEVAKLACTVSNGHGEVAFTPKDYGQYLVRLHDPQGGSSADISFYCAGEGFVPWAMEKPSRIELVADKARYAPGETAVVLVKAPFAGQALFTVESDQVLLAQTVTLSANTTEWRFPVGESFGPNVYCSATVVRKVGAGGKATAHRAYGAVPIVLDTQRRRLRVEVEAPEEVRPGRSMRIALRVRDAEGVGRPAEVTLAAVDEGICRLTRYQTPDPWRHFYAKRALNVGTSDVFALLMPEVGKQVGGDSTAAGGAAGYDPRQFNPVSVERVRQVALWRSGIETDAEGRAEIVIEVPEFTGQLRLMAVAAGTSHFGAADRPTIVKQPLLARASFPRFVAPGDEFLVPLTVFNHTGGGGSVALATETSGGLTVGEDAPRSVGVPKDGEKTTFFRVQAPEVPGPVALIIAAELGGETATATVELPVRPPSTLRHKSGSGAIRAGETGRITLPGGWLKGTDTYSLSFSPLPSLKLGECLRWLLRYPYGCIEQTTSSAFPLVYLGDIIDAVDPERFDKQAAHDYLQAGVDRVLSMQTHNGGFAAWPGYWAAYPWGSVYATHFLVEAAKGDADVPEDNLDAALDYLDAQLAGDAKLPIKAYACYVLAVAGRPNGSWTYRLYEEREDLPAYSRYHVATALALMKERKLVGSFLKEAKLPDVTPQRDTGGVLHSSARESAMLLSAYLELDPQHAHVPLLVQRLEGAMKGGRWYTTQENAFAALALGKYARHQKGQQADFKATATVDGRPLKAFGHNDKVVLRPEGLGGKAVEVRVEGAGTLYYFWSADGIPIKDEVEEEDRGMKVRRRFLSRKGEPLDARQLPHGEIVVVELTIEASRTVENVVISDLLPGGLEIENPRLASSETLRLPRRDGDSRLNPDRVEMRDDRLLIFTDLGAGKTRYHRYLARAVTRGRFHLPPVSALAMYDPGVSSTHGSGMVEVID